MKIMSCMFIVSIIVCATLYADPLLQDLQEDKAVYLTDMSKCVPSSALSDKPLADSWHLVDYTADEGISGKMLTAEATVDPPDVMLPLKYKGWYAISIAYWSGIYYDCSYKYRLSNQDIYTKVHAPFPWTLDHIKKAEIVEVFPFYADLTGVEGLYLAKQSAKMPRKAFIAYVKLTPLTGAQVKRIKKDRADKSTRKLIATNDAEGEFQLYSMKTRQELLEQVEQYRHSDVGKVFWGMNLGDLTYYKSKVGRFYLDGEAYPRQELKYAHDNWKALYSQGIEPYKEIMKHVQSMDREFYAYYRMAIIDHIHPYNLFSAESIIMEKYPGINMVGKDGTPTIKVSYAFPEVRKFMVDMMSEPMAKGVDGIALCYVRGPRYVGYEKPVVDEYIKRYGKDPRKLPEDDLKLQELQGEYLTMFMRDLRKAADKHGKKLGKKIKIAAWTEWSDERMKQCGYDVDTWIDEGLVDCLLTIGPQRIVKKAKEKGCEVYAYGSGGGNITDVADVTHAYASGMDGIVFWDLDGVQYLPEKWAFLQRLGHKEEMLDMPPLEQYFPKMKHVRLKTLRGREIWPTETYRPTGSPVSEMLHMYTGG